jgi:hypothetical protein
MKLILLTLPNYFIYIFHYNLNLYIPHTAEEAFYSPFFFLINRYVYQRCYLAKFQKALLLHRSINQMLTIELKMVNSGVCFQC